MWFKSLTGSSPVATHSISRPSNSRMACILTVAIIGVFAAIPLPAQTATSFSENFAGPTINGALQDLSGNYVFNGSAANPTDSRTYIATVATDYLNYDFTAMLTYTVQSGTGGNNMFFGIGSGLPDPNFYDEPLTAVYLRSDPDNFNSGGAHVTLNDGAGNVTEGSTIGSPGDGTSRALLTKTGDTVTFAVDPNSSSGAFVAAYSESFSVANDLAFLNDANSSLFFGSTTGTTFQALTVDVAAVPEPSVLALFALGSVGVRQILRRRK
jgi:hypothetical protein